MKAQLPRRAGQHCECTTVNKRIARKTGKLPIVGKLAKASRWVLRGHQSSVVTSDECNTNHDGFEEIVALQQGDDFCRTFRKR